MDYPSNYLYTKDHEWAFLESEDIVLVGITHHAQEALGEIVYVELPAVGRSLNSHEAFGVVESIKAVSDLYSPVKGTVVGVNAEVSANNTLLNESPHDKGWLMRIRITDKSELKNLLSVADYKKLIET